MCITHFNSRDLGVCVCHIPTPGSFLAEAVIQDLENRAVTNNDIKIWDRYVDDVFATVKKEKKTDGILQTINNTTKDTKFTKEEEYDNFTINSHFWAY
jgi:hypothetical protein